jgi:enamine deaminase RidA (YjgF/YER057c/UK114 family)
MIKRTVRPSGSSKPGGAYSHVVVANGFVFVAGQGPEVADSGTVPSDFEDQVEQVLTNLRTALRSVGCDLTGCVRQGVQNGGHGLRAIRPFAVDLCAPPTARPC